MIRHAEVDGPRPVQPHEHTEAIALCNRVLRPNGPPTIAEEYPQVFARANAGNMWVITLEGRVVSHVATYASTLELAGGAQLRLGGISSVATEPSARHRGYASRLMEACCRQLDAQGCHFAVLWTEIHAFYERLGFTSLGAELLYRLTPADVRDVTTDADIEASRPAEADTLARLRAAVRPYTHRSPEEWAALRRIPKMQVWVARREGRPAAYLAVGKGEDFRNCCHEWAGDARDVLGLIAHAATRSRRREVILLAPDDAAPLNELLQRRNTPHIRTDLGMFRCLNPVATLDALRPTVEPLVGMPLALEPVDGQWRLHVGEAHVGPFTTEMFSALVLGPRKAMDIFLGPEDVCAALERGFPVPMFIWGLDSV